MIKRLFVIGSLLVAASSAVAGNSTIDTQFFTLTADDMEHWYGGGEFDLAVVAQTGNSVQIRMGGMFGPAPSLAVDTSTGAWPSDSRLSAGIFLGNMKAGYRITSLSIAGVASGSLSPAALPALCQAGASCTPGKATNSLEASLSIRSQGHSVRLPDAAIENFTGPTPFALTGQVDIGGQFGMTLQGDLGVAAESARIVYSYDNDGYSEWHTHSKASASLDQPFLLTIEVAPVPEPATYAMMLGGLALLGAAARRRR